MASIMRSKLAMTLVGMVVVLLLPSSSYGWLSVKPHAGVRPWVTRSPITTTTTPINKFYPVSAAGGELPRLRQANPALRTPDENYQNAVQAGVKKANMSPFKIFVLAILAGFQVGVGTGMAVHTLGTCPGLLTNNPGLGKVLFGAIGLPCSLLSIMITGTELFTGNTALVSVALYEGKVKKRQVIKSFFWSFVGNLIGSLIFALLCDYSGVFAASAKYMASVGDYKASFPFGVAVVRGLICNWLVCQALWVSMAASDLVSKAVASIMTITIFAALGFEHSVANMFVGPAAAFFGAKTGYLKFLEKNMLPVTLGNYLGGGFLVAGINYLAYGSFMKKKNGQRGGYYGR